MLKGCSWDSLIIDLRQIEDVYIRLVEQPWPADDEEDFPLVLKVEFLKELFFWFDSCGSITRAMAVLEIIQGLVERHPADLDLGETYIR